MVDTRSRIYRCTPKFLHNQTELLLVPYIVTLHRGRCNDATPVVMQSRHYTESSTPRERESGKTVVIHAGCIKHSCLLKGDTNKPGEFSIYYGSLPPPTLESSHDDVTHWSTQHTLHNHGTLTDKSSHISPLQTSLYSYTLWCDSLYAWGSVEIPT